MVLTGKAMIEGNVFGGNGCFTVGCIAGLPNSLLSLITYNLWCTEMIALNTVGIVFVYIDNGRKAEVQGVVVSRFF